MVMECVVDGCQFATKELEPAVAVELLKLHDKNQHTQSYGGSTTERRCQAKRQLFCLGEKPDWDTADSSCDLCYRHFRSCPWKTGNNWCQGEVCQYDMEKSSNARVDKEETPDEATDVRLEHWGRGAELVGDKVAGLGKHVEATDVVEESSWPEVAKGKVSFECGNCHYTTPTLRRSKATQKLRAHSRGCKAWVGGPNQDNQAELGVVQENTEHGYTEQPKRLETAVPSPVEGTLSTEEAPAPAAQENPHPSPPAAAQEHHIPGAQHQPANTEGRCQSGQFFCLGQLPRQCWRWCEVCDDHYFGTDGHNFGTDDHYSGTDDHYFGTECRGETCQEAYRQNTEQSSKERLPGKRQLTKPLMLV